MNIADLKMTEKRIIIEEVDPVDIYGINNRLLICSGVTFQRCLLLQMRILLKGSAADVKNFESKISLLTEMRMKRTRLTEDDINSLFDSSHSDKSAVQDDVS
ncbi:hypothetical protein MASR1M46_17180 [Bacteroidales bacterium]